MKIRIGAILLVSFGLGLSVFIPASDADLGDCGQPITSGAAPAASDALYVLRAAVGIDSCAAMVCDTDGSCTVTAGDALRLLSHVTGQPYALVCDLCGVSTTSTSTTSTSTTTLPAATWSDVLEIFAGHSCALSGCHGAGGSGGDLGGLDSFNSGHSQLLNDSVSCVGSLYDDLVVPFDPDSSFLVAKLEGFHDCGSPMPLVGAPLNLQELDAVRSWILSGAPKN
jgi:hypothetical protein